MNEDVGHRIKMVDTFNPAVSKLFVLLLEHNVVQCRRQNTHHFMKCDNKVKTLLFSVIDYTKSFFLTEGNFLLIDSYPWYHSTQ